MLSSYIEATKSVFRNEANYFLFEGDPSGVDSIDDDFLRRGSTVALRAASIAGDDRIVKDIIVYPTVGNLHSRSIGLPEQERW